MAATKRSTGRTRSGRHALALVFALSFAVAAMAQDAQTDVVKDLIRQYDAVGAEIDRTLRQVDAGAVPAYPRRMLSLRRNAQVTIGGELRTDYVFSTSNTPDLTTADPLLSSATSGKARVTDFSVNTADLLVSARAGRWRAHVQMHLNGSGHYHDVQRVRRTADGRYEFTKDAHYIPGEAYIEIIKDGHSGFGVRAGLLDLRFGLDAKPNLLGHSYISAPNLTQSWLGKPVTNNDGIFLPHASKLADPVAALEISYEMRDIIRFDAALFQEVNSSRHSPVYDAGGGRWRTDSVAPLSHQFGISILPLDGWELSMTYRNRASRTRGMLAWMNSPWRTDVTSLSTEEWSQAHGGKDFGARRSEQAFTVGLALDIPRTMLSVFIEYAHGWNQGFSKYIKSDDVHFGLAWRLGPRLTLYGQAEWLRVRDNSYVVRTAGGWMRDARNSRLVRTLLGLRYELLRGLTLEAGWQYEYWKYTSALGRQDAPGATHRVYTANMLYMGTRFLF